MGKPKRLPAPPPSATKNIPKAAGIIRRAEGCPSWRFSEICLDGEWGWGDPSAARVLDFLAWSKAYESMTWPEIYKGGQAGKSFPKEDLPLKAQNELRRTRHDDVDDIVELRPAGKPRTFGVRHGSALLLLFSDPNHTFYPTKNNRRPTGN